jgi:hypothetical protein
MGLLVRTILLGAALVLAAPGCARKDKPIPIRGTVTLDGQPVVGAAVNFVPEGGNGVPAYAMTKEGGVFDLTTTSLGDGAMAGNYMVTITWEEPHPPAFRPREGGLSKAQMARKLELEEERRKKMRHQVNIPEVYGNPSQTPLRQKVPPSGKVEFNLDSKAK